MGGDFGFLTSEDVVVLNPPIATDVSGSEQAAVWKCQCTTGRRLETFAKLFRASRRLNVGQEFWSPEGQVFESTQGHGKRILTRGPSTHESTLCAAIREVACALCPSRGAKSMAAATTSSAGRPFNDKIRTCSGSSGSPESRTHKARPSMAHRMGSVPKRILHPKSNHMPRLLCDCLAELEAMCLPFARARDKSLQATFLLFLPMPDSILLLHIE